MVSPYQMTIGAVAEAINRSVARVKQLDDVLKPVRGKNGHRRYDAAVVADYLAKRGAK